MDDAQPNPKLTGQILRVYEALTAGEWVTLPEIAVTTGDSQSSCSAQVRHLRKKDNGGYQVLKRRRGRAASGLFEYWLVR
jgi:biotin operon repressor